MPQVSAALDDCSTTERVAALLYLGWTHEEIAAVTNISKGTVQNRRAEIEAGDLGPPPEAFNLVRRREREVHRVARDIGTSTDANGTQVADRVAAIADLDALGIGPDGEISYEELVAFATLVAGQLAEFEPREVVDRLVVIADLVDDLPGPPETMIDRLRLFGAEFHALHAAVAELDLPIDEDSDLDRPVDGNTPEKWTSWSEDHIDEPASSAMLDLTETEQQFDTFQGRDQASRTFGERSNDSRLILRDGDPKECWRHQGTYDEETGECWLDPPASDDDYPVGRACRRVLIAQRNTSAAARSGGMDWICETATERDVARSSSR